VVSGSVVAQPVSLAEQAGFRESFAYAGESVDRGYSILVFPEGHHTSDGKIRPFRAGAGMLANNLAVPVVPLRISGLFRVEAGREKICPAAADTGKDRTARAISA